MAVKRVKKQSRAQRMARPEVPGGGWDGQRWGSGRVVVNAHHQVRQQTLKSWCFPMFSSSSGVNPSGGKRAVGLELKIEISLSLINFPSSPRPPPKKSASLFSATAVVAQVWKPLPGRKPVLAKDQTVALFQEKFGFHLTTIGFQIVIWACLKSGECVSVVKCSWTSLVPGLFRTDPGNFFQMFWGIQVHIKGMVMLLLPY